MEKVANLNVGSISNIVSSIYSLVEKLELNQHRNHPVERRTIPSNFHTNHDTSLAITEGNNEFILTKGNLLEKFHNASKQLSIIAPNGENFSSKWMPIIPSTNNLERNYEPPVATNIRRVSPDVPALAAREDSAENVVDSLIQTISKYIEITFLNMFNVKRFFTLPMNVQILVTSCLFIIEIEHLKVILSSPDMEVYKTTNRLRELSANMMNDLKNLHTVLSSTDVYLPSVRRFFISLLSRYPGTFQTESLDSPDLEYRLKQIRFCQRNCESANMLSPTCSPFTEFLPPDHNIDNMTDNIPKTRGLDTRRHSTGNTSQQVSSLNQHITVNNYLTPPRPMETTTPPSSPRRKTCRQPGLHIQGAGESFPLTSLDGRRNSRDVIPSNAELFTEIRAIARSGFVPNQIEIREYTGAKLQRVCFTCNSSGCTIHDLMMHWNHEVVCFYMRDKPYQCEACSKAFYITEMFIQHTRTAHQYVQLSPVKTVHGARRTIERISHSVRQPITSTVSSPSTSLRNVPYGRQTMPFPTFPKQNLASPLKRKCSVLSSDTVCSPNFAKKRTKHTTSTDSSPTTDDVDISKLSHEGRTGAVETDNNIDDSLILSIEPISATVSPPYQSRSTLFIDLCDDEEVFYRRNDCSEMNHIIQPPTSKEHTAFDRAIYSPIEVLSDNQSDLHQRNVQYPNNTHSSQDNSQHVISGGSVILGDNLSCDQTAYSPPVPQRNSLEEAINPTANGISAIQSTTIVSIEDHENCTERNKPQTSNEATSEDPNTQDSRDVNLTNDKYIEQRLKTQDMCAIQTSSGSESGYYSQKNMKPVSRSTSRVQYSHVNNDLCNGDTSIKKNHLVTDFATSLVSPQHSLSVCADLDSGIKHSVECVQEERKPFSWSAVMDEEDILAMLLKIDADIDSFQINDHNYAPPQEQINTPCQGSEQKSRAPVISCVDEPADLHSNHMELPSNRSKTICILNADKITGDVVTPEVTCKDSNCPVKKVLENSCIILSDEECDELDEVLLQ